MTSELISNLPLGLVDHDKSKEVEDVTDAKLPFRRRPKAGDGAVGGEGGVVHAVAVHQVHHGGDAAQGVVLHEPAQVDDGLKGGVGLEVCTCTWSIRMMTNMKQALT